MKFSFLKLNIFFVNVFLAGFLFLIIGQTYTPPANSPLANHIHPRIFFTDSTLQAIKNYIDIYEASNFQAYINEVDAAYNDDIPSKVRNWLIMDANNFAFLCLAVHSGYFTNYSFGHTESEYLQKAYDHAIEIDYRARNDVWFRENHRSFNLNDPMGGNINLALAAIYDWCFDLLSLSQKQFIADALIYLYTNRPPEVNPNKKSRLTNHLAYNHHGAVGGLAIWGDDNILGSNYAAVAQEMLNMISWNWYDCIYLAGEHLFEGTTGWSEGLNYISGGLGGTYWFSAAFLTATGINPIYEYKWLYDAPLYLFFNIFPMYIAGNAPDYYYGRNDDINLRSQNTWGGTITAYQIISPIVALKQIDPDFAGFYRWLLEDSPYAVGNVFQNENPRLLWLFYKFIWGIKDVPKKPLSQMNLKKSYRFGLGETIFKSDLTTEDATKITFWTPKYWIFHHAHLDAGSFAIFKYGTLALDAGNNKGGGIPDCRPYAKHPIFHNVMALYGPGDSTTYFYNSGTNEWAAAYNHPDNQPGGANHIGDVISLKFEDDIFDYVDFDYTRSYKGENYVNRIRRKLLYIRDPNAPNYTNKEYVVVFDDVDVTNINIKKRWLLHTAFEPVLIDGSFSQIEPGFWTTTTGSIIEVTNTYGNAHGRMYVKFLAPDNYELRLRGGSDGGTQYWYRDAEGNDLTYGTGNANFDDWSAFWVGSYRLEVEDLTLNNPSQFLTVMQIGDANTLNSMVPVQSIDTGDFLGSLINEDRIVFFNKSTTPKNYIDYLFNSNRHVKHIITGLEQGLYYIRQNGTPIPGYHFVDESGVLYFEQNGGGTFVISRSNDTIPPNTPTGFQITK